VEVAGAEPVEKTAKKGKKKESTAADVAPAAPVAKTAKKSKKLDTPE